MKSEYTSRRCDTFGADVLILLYIVRTYTDVAPDCLLLSITYTLLTNAQYYMVHVKQDVVMARRRLAVALGGGGQVRTLMMSKTSEAMNMESSL